MHGKSTRLGLASLAAFSLILALANVSQALPAYSGGSGLIAFGVAPYGAPPAVGPAYIPNNFTGRIDVLATPGIGNLGPYQTASPVVANNLSNTPLGGTPPPFFAFQFGGANGFGAFGAAGANHLGTTMGYGITDSAPGGGSASYLIDSGKTTFTEPAAGPGTPAGTKLSAWLTMAGNVNLVGTAVVTSLKVHLQSANVLSPFFNAGAGVDLPNMILAISRNNNTGILANDYNIIKVGGGAVAGGVGAGGAALIVDNVGTGAFRSLALDIFSMNTPIPAGDIINVDATLTGYADPASMSTFDDLSNNLDLVALAGGELPSNSFMGMDTFPEPASLWLGALALGMLRSRRKVRAAAGVTAFELSQTTLRS